MSFDTKVKFVINLDSRPDRLDRFKKTFNTQLTREPGYLVKDEIPPGLKKRINPWNFKYLPEKKLKGIEWIF